MEFEFGDVVRFDGARHLVLGVVEQCFEVFNLAVTTDDTPDNIKAKPGQVLVICIDDLPDNPFGFIDSHNVLTLTKEA